MATPAYFTTKMQTAFKCLRCGHVWIQRYPGRLPISCPNSACRSKAWRVPRNGKVKR